MVRSLAWAVLLPWVVGGCGTVTGPVGIGDRRVFPHHREVDVRWRSADGTYLEGTVLLPRGEGPFPAVIAHFGSGAWGRRDVGISVRRAWLDRDWGILLYDKRGFAGSGGSCCDIDGSGSIERMGEDVAAGVRMLRTVEGIDPHRVGLYGYSQGGWVLPRAAVIVGDVAFSVIGSGAAVSVGEERLYSRLTGDDDCRSTGIPPTELARRMASAAPTDFDPRPDLRVMPNPGYWFFGGRDTSNPVEASIASLAVMRDRYGRAYSWTVFHEANHEMVVGGGMCVVDGARVPYWDAVFEWIGSLTE